MSDAIVVPVLRRVIKCLTGPLEAPRAGRAGAVLRSSVVVVVLSSVPAVAQGGVHLYVEHVLGLIEQHSLMRYEVDMAAYGAEVRALAREAGTMDEVYDVIEVALERLGDGHSYLRRPPERAGATGSGTRRPQAGLGLHSGSLTILSVYPGSPAAEAGLRRGERIVRVNGTTVTDENRQEMREAAGTAGSRLLVYSPFSGETRDVVTEPGEFAWSLAPNAYRFGDRIGVLEVPAHAGGGAVPGVGDYAEVAHREIAALDVAGVCGWVVDLRLNSGGNMWPMIEAVGPLLGTGDVGAFVEADGSTSFVWTYDGETASVAPRAYARNAAGPPVAVLTSDHTISSGEAVVVAFQGRPRTRFFGEATHGVPTANRTFELPSGAAVVLTTAFDADREGRIYDGPIEPDELVTVDWSKYGAPDDPVLLAVRDWLEQQEACRTAGQRSNLGVG